MIKKCFIIGPIGNDNSSIRENSNKLLEYIIKPVLDDLKYEAPNRSDYLTQPGLITSQIINGIDEAGFVIADLTGHNPNVYYELGFCHTINKPTILMQSDSSELPFDVGGIRTIFYNFDISKVNEVKENLKNQILHIEDKNEFYNPISFSISVDNLKVSPDDIVKQTILQILGEVKEIKKMINNVKNKYNGQPYDISSNLISSVGGITNTTTNAQSLDSNILDIFIKSFLNPAILNGNRKT